ncbi:hypothetical protein C8R43DRAFT_942946 [Mycena crocata]|nr:hypothetical protein C8R43DRAFT_942946 [Mycena crocata]
MSMKLAPAIDSNTLPSTPASEWATSTTDILAYKNGSTVQTPGPPIPGAFPDEPFFGPNDVGSILRATAEVAKTYLPAQITGYFDAVFLTIYPSPEEPAPPVGTPHENNLDVDEDVDDDYVPSDVPIELSPTSLKPVRPRFFIRSSSSFHSHAFGPARSASSSIYSPSVSSSPVVTPGALGYTPLTSSPTLSSSNGIARGPGAVPFTPIPPITPPELLTYFSVAGALGEMTEYATSMEQAEDEFETEQAHKETLAHPETDEDAQRAVFSDPHFSVLGRAGTPLAPTNFSRTESTAAVEDMAIFTAHGVHVPVQPAAAHFDVNDGEYARSNSGDSANGQSASGKSRRSRLFAKVKQNMRV